MAEPTPKPQDKPTAKTAPKTTLAQRLEAAVQSFQRSVEELIASMRPQSQASVRQRVPATPKAIRAGFEDYSWNRSIVAWMIAGLLTNAILLVVMLAATNAAASRPVGYVKGQASIKDKIEVKMSEQFVHQKDALDLYLRTTLPILQGMGPEGHFALEKLRGVVAPEIISRANESYQAQSNSIRKNVITQTLVILESGNIEVDKEKGRVSIYVKGQFVIAMGMTKAGPRASIVPYRARVVVESNQPSRLNPLHFYMVGLTEKVGQAALAWDEEQTLNK